MLMGHKRAPENRRTLAPGRNTTPYGSSRYHVHLRIHPTNQPVRL